MMVIGIFMDEEVALMMILMVVMVEAVILMMIVELFVGMEE